MGRFRITIPQAKMEELKRQAQAEQARDLGRWLGWQVNSVFGRSFPYGKELVSNTFGRCLYLFIYIFWNAWAIVSHWYPMFEPSTCQELCQDLPTKPMSWISTEHGNILPIGMALFPANAGAFTVVFSQVDLREEFHGGNLNKGKIR